MYFWGFISKNQSSHLSKIFLVMTRFENFYSNNWVSLLVETWILSHGIFHRSLQNIFAKKKTGVFES